MKGKRFLPNNILIDNQLHVLMKTGFVSSGKGIFLLVLLLISSMSFGQGPAGVSNGIKFWLDASDLDGDGVVEGMGEAGINLVDSTIIEWQDKSASLSGTHFTVPVSSSFSGPKYLPLEAGFDGRTTIDFSDTTTLSHIPAGSWTQNHTIFIVFKQKTVSVAAGTSIFSSGIGLTGDPSLDDHFRIGSAEGTASSFSYYVSEGTGGTPTYAESVFGTQTAAQGSVMLYSATRKVDTVTTYLNGTSTNTATVDPGGKTFDHYFLNSNRDSTLLNDCMIAEVILYEGVLTSADLTKVNDYLTCKYIGAPTVTIGPGGLEPCNLSLWLKADAGVSLNGWDNLTNWADQGSYGFDGTTSGGDRPHFSLMDNNFNPSFEFDKSNHERIDLEFANTLDELMMGASDFSFYAVAKADTGTLFADNRCLDENGYKIGFGNDKWDFLGGAASGSYTDSATVETSNTLTPYSIVNFKRSGTSYNAQTNEGGGATGTSITPINYSYSTDETERWIGAHYNCSGVDYLDGNLSELIIVRGTVSSASDAQVQSYLGLKYGLTLDQPTVTNYVSSNGTILWDNTSFWNDVAGIGQDDGSVLDQRISKSQDASAIVTMATIDSFVIANADGAFSSLGDGNFLVWGNNNNPASSAWSAGGAPTGYAINPASWKIKETGTVGAVSIQIDVDDADNNIPFFIGDLYLVYGSSINSGTTALMTNKGSGIYTVSGIDFNDGDFFTVGVKNDFVVEFSSAAESSLDESTVVAFTDVIGTGTVNVATTFEVVGAGAGATGGGVDYSYSNETINVGVGVYTDSAFVIVPPTLVQDVLDEGNENIQFTINPGLGVTVGDANGGGPTNFHIYTITDDDSYIVSIGHPTDGIENSVDVTYKVFIVGGTNTSGSAITGSIAWSGSATNGSDFDPSTVTGFSIPNNGDTVLITLPILDDSFLENTETVTATIGAISTGVTLIDNATADIIDDEMTGVYISVDSPVDADEGSNVSFTFSLPVGITNESGMPITGNISYAGLALDGTDYAGETDFTILTGANSTVESFLALPDNLVEVTESVIASITPGSLNIGIPDPGALSATADIFDEDTTGLTVSISAPISTVVENSGIDITYVVELDGGKINGTGSDITGVVSYGGTALGGTVDYTEVLTFAIPDGTSSGTIDVPVHDDLDIEGTETVIATIVSSIYGIPNPNVLNNTMSVDILDDESGTLFISIGSPTDTTEGLGITPFVSFSVFIEGGGVAATAITGSLNYAGTATGSDFTTVPTFTIPIGANSTTIVLPVLDDGTTEPTETVVANLIGVPTLGDYANTSSTATIYDDDASSLLISIGNAVDGSEAGTSVTFSVYLDGGSINGTGGAILGSITYGGSAVPADFSSGQPAFFSIPNGQSSTTITLDVADDNAVEITEDIVATISGATLGTISATNFSASADIIDNDLGALTISLTTPTDGEEGGADASFLVLMDGGYTNGLGVPLTGTVSFSGTSTVGSDFQDESTFEIPVGANFVVHTVPILDDISLELTETLIATISAPSAGTVSATVTDTADIIDNDLIGAQLEISAGNVGVESPTIPVDPEFTVSIVGGLQNETGSDITGVISLSGSAIEGSDYTAGFTNFVIPNNSAFVALPMPVIDDGIEEQTEFILGVISSPNMGLSIATDSATVEILDDDTDTDNDGMPDLTDPITGNIDSDCDGIFDGCDADADGDGILDLGAFDADGDGINDACDADQDGDGNIDNGPDSNNDGLNDVEWDPTDSDFDLLPDHVDPNDNNPDSDGDGIPDGADVDVNGDDINDNGCDDNDDGVHNIADADDNPYDDITDVGNLDGDGDGIDDYWDLVDNRGGGQSINYIVSPNNDNVNETFFIKGIQFFERHELRIFNRWGTLIYRSIDYKNNWAGEAEEGINLGSETLTEGTYYYILDQGNGEEFVRGYIEIRY